jgi:hypothetical protein
MIFSERKKLAAVYKRWLKKNPVVKDCAFNVIGFLYARGWLKEKQDKRVIALPYFFKGMTAHVAVPMETNKIRG